MFAPIGNPATFNSLPNVAPRCLKVSPEKDSFLLASRFLYTIREKSGLIGAFEIPAAAANPTENMKHCYLLSLLILPLSLQAGIPEGYGGTPFIHPELNEGPQVIPGRVEMAFFDFGGEGVAYHDSDPSNEGAMVSYIKNRVPPETPKEYFAFREKEGVDLIYMKRWLDFKDENIVHPHPNQLYIGWQEDGEWTNYTVNVLFPGTYRVIATYANEDNGSTLAVNGGEPTSLKLPVATGYWHHWNHAVVGEVEFKEAGLNLLTLNYNAGANLACLDFIFLR